MERHRDGRAGGLSGLNNLSGIGGSHRIGDPIGSDGIWPWVGGALVAALMMGAALGRPSPTLDYSEPLVAQGPRAESLP